MSPVAACFEDFRPGDFLPLYAGLGVLCATACPIFGISALQPSCALGWCLGMFFGAPPML